MGTENILSSSVLMGFLLTMARVSSVFVFVPVPGLKSAVDPARILLMMGVSVALFPVWPRVPAETPPGLLAVWILSEAALGVGIGLAVAFAVEAFSVGAQLIGMQAGYSFASTIDPSTQADSTVLIVLAQTSAAVLFFVMGLDREILRIFARSMQTYPPGSFVLTRGAAETVLLAGSTMFSTGLRLALPIIAVMVMVDISLALLGRVNSQLQLLSIAFPIKMMVAVGLLAWLSMLLPTLLRGGSEFTFRAARALAVR